MQSHSFQKEFIEPIESMGFSRFDLDYWKNPQLFSAFFSGLPDTNVVIQQIKNRSSFKYRTEISSILKNQYKEFDPQSKVFSQIAKLEQSNTFTVVITTGNDKMGDVELNFYDNAVNKVNGVYYLRRYTSNNVEVSIAPLQVQF